jgi:hypothetical protein
MKNLILAGVAIALLAGTPYASTAFAAADDPAADSDHHGMGARAALLDAWLGGLKAGLKLTADQEKNWPVFENAVRGAAKDRADRFHARREHEDDAGRPSLIERLRMRSDRLAQRSTELKVVADAAAPLYASLDDGQKRTFGVLFHVLARESHFGGRRERDHSH